MRVFELCDRFDFGKYKGEYVLDVLVKDSGYIRSLIILNDKNPGFVLSNKAFQITQLITKGFREKEPAKSTSPTSFLDNLKSYAVPYDFDFNNDELIKKNNEKLKLAGV